ncbi:MAG: hypothetical protein HZA16_11880 [Nitrospirae bacterium]|nr:hypothetical protein [Nitrospirota bacterium]
MSKRRIMAILLVVAGTAGLVYGQFTYTKETHKTQLGPLEIKVKEKETVDVPAWAGAGAIAVGVILLLTDKKR